MRAVTPCVVQEERASKVIAEATKVTLEEELPAKVATGALIEETEVLEAPEAPTKVVAVKIGVLIEAQRSRNTANVVEIKVAAAEIGVSMKTVELPAEVAKTAGAQQAARV
jgi:hypothetical protein